MCKGGVLASSQCMTYTAGLVAMWDIEMAGRGIWQLPKHAQASDVYSMRGDNRVYITRRSLPKTEENVVTQAD
nr:hypothetical protein CFP56_34949 [Quercus suber]